MITKKQIKYIQALRRRVGVSDDDYAAMKKSVGVASTTELDDRRFNTLIARLEGRGDEAENGGAPAKRYHSSARASGMHREPTAAKQLQIAKVEALLANMKLPWSYADALARRMYKTDMVRWCTGEQLRGVIAALVKRQQKQKTISSEEKRA